ncbi:ACT domain repeat 3 [Wolffia australiana]
MERGACWPYFDPEYENLSQRINPPRVSIDNSTCSDCTLVKVDSMNRPGILLEVVQVLSDLDLTITKAYISSDGGWFMDVFHVTDQHGMKVTDKKVIESIEMALGPKSKALSRSGAAWLPGKAVGMHSAGNCTAIELIGADRPGLLSEIFAVLTNLRCNVLAAEVWTHNTRVACVVYVNDGETGGHVDDPDRLRAMEEQLKNVLSVWGDDRREAKTSFSLGGTHVDRRLHQLMAADKDYEGVAGDGGDRGGKMKPAITVDQCDDKGYSVVNVQCKDRPKLLFDIVCTLTDMQFVVFHASISSDGPIARQEYYIRHADGCTLESKEEKERVVKCLEAAIKRRTSDGISLELCGRDRVGLLSDVTRVLRENGLSVTRAGVTTVGEQALDVFYVRDASGHAIDAKTIEALRKEIGHTVRLNVKRVPDSIQPQRYNSWPKNGFSIGSLLERFLS